MHCHNCGADLVCPASRSCSKCGNAEPDEEPASEQEPKTTRAQFSQGRRGTQRFYPSAEIHKSISKRPSGTAPNSISNRLQIDYQQTCDQFKMLADIRFKLLAIIPTLAGLAIGLLKSEFTSESALAIGILGFVVTTGITIYELRNSRFYDFAVHRAKYLERRMKLEESIDNKSDFDITYGGLCNERPGRKTSLIKGREIIIWHDLGLGLVYSATLGSWIFVIVNSLLLLFGLGTIKISGILALNAIISIPVAIFGAIVIFRRFVEILNSQVSPQAPDLPKQQRAGKSEVKRPVLLAIDAIVGIVYFFVVVVTFHFLRPDYNPVTRFIGEYAVGPFGSLMTTAFFALAIGSLALVIGLRRKVSPSIWSTIGLVLLALWVVGIFIAGIFPTDLVGAPETIPGDIHYVASLASFISVILAIIMWLISFRLDKQWRSFFPRALWMTLLALAAFIIFLISMMSTRREFVGFSERGFVIAILLWLFVTAMHLGYGGATAASNSAG